MEQSGLGVKKGTIYSGYIILSGSKGVKVEISLVVDSATIAEQTITIDQLTDQYRKYEFTFTESFDSENATLAITGTGKGYFKIGAVSLMPADNLKGYRADIVALLKELNSGIYRWPGGNMLAGYDWRNGIGDRDKRPPKYDYAWNAVEPNDVGSHEFMDLCELLNIDPYFVVNIGFGDDYSAAQWVEYMNGDEHTAMGKLRAANGHPEPYGVKWWGIGNEMYGQWQLGHMSIDHYILKHNYFAEAMLKADSTITIIGCGATPFETSTTARHNKYPLPNKLPYAYGSDGDWTGKLLEYASGNIDVMAEHLYPFTDHAFDADSQKFLVVNDPLEDQVRRIPNRIKGLAEAWEEYTKKMPELKDADIKFAIDEWTGGGWRSGFLRTLCAAEGLHEIFRHTDIITMGGYTAVTSCVRFNATDACYSSTGLLFKMYRDNFGTIPVDVNGNSPQKPVKGTIGVDKPSVTSGSNTYPLDIMAAKTADGRYITVAIINPTTSKQELKLNFNETKFKNKVKVFRIVPPELKAANTPGKEQLITMEESEINIIPETLIVEPISISLYKLELK